MRINLQRNERETQDHTKKLVPGYTFIGVVVVEAMESDDTIFNVCPQSQ